MQEQNNKMDDLLVKYLLDEAMPEEKRAVDEWLAADDTNRRYYDHFKLIWEQSKNLAAQSHVDTDAAWQRFQQRVVQAEQTISPEKKSIVIRPNNTLKIAASLIFILGAAWLTYFFSTKSGMQTLASTDHVLVDTLPDGSVVTLNKHSSITFPSTFEGDMRSVSMEGEAFFNITPDKSKPFIIAANGINVKVVGTSFNVKSSDVKTEVIVETGVVEVRKRSEFVTLNPHEQAVVLKSDVKPVKLESKDKLYSYYRTNEFVCDGTPLWRLVDVLKEAYGTDIVIADEQLKNKTIFTTFRGNSLEQILDVVQATYEDVAVEKSSGRFILKSR